MRRLAWDTSRRHRSAHAFAKKHDILGLMASIETYLNDWRGYPSRVHSMPACVFRRRPL